MRICIISKYPPIQGGVSVTNYWISRTLAQHGHTVHVVTNADEVEDRFRILLTPEDDHWLGPRFDVGSVRVWNTERPGPEYYHIPEGNPFVTKLATLAAQAVDSSGADVIVSYYLEPYAIAAYLVSTWTGTPFIIRHAGSDIGRLLKTPQLHRCYKEILQRARLVLTSERLFEFFVSLGVEPDRLYQDPGFALPHEYFNTDAEPLSINDFLSGLVGASDAGGRSRLGWHTDPIDPSLPSLGVYGKIAKTKGLFDLVEALACLKRRGLRFNLIAIAHGLQERENRFRTAIVEANLERETRILPFIPHWRIPSFLRCLSAVCFLERDFPIKWHAPVIPREALSCGTCLVVSGEVAGKQFFCERLNHGVNALIVRDPRDHAETTKVLETVITDPDKARRIGTRGALLAQRFEDLDRCTERHEALLARAGAGATRVTNPRHFFCAGAGRLERTLGRLLPLTTRLLGRQITEVMGRLRSIPTICDGQDRYTTALEMCEAIAPLVEKRESHRDYLADIMRWELFVIPRNSAPLADIVDKMLFRSAHLDAENLTEEAALDLIPVSLENVSMCEFRYDMEALTQNAQEVLPAEVPTGKQPSYYVFQSLPLRPRARVLRVNLETFLLLRMCDGCRTTREIAAEFAASAPERSTLCQDEIGNWCTQTVLFLFSEGLLRLLPSTANAV